MAVESMEKIVALAKTEALFTPVRNLRRSGKHMGLWYSGCRAEKQHEKSMVEEIYSGKPQECRR